MASDHINPIYLLLGVLLAAAIAALLASSCLFSIRSRVTTLVSVPAVRERVSSGMSEEGKVIVYICINMVTLSRYP